MGQAEKSLRRRETGEGSGGGRGEREVAFVGDGELSQSCGGQRGGREPGRRGESRGGGGIHGNKPVSGKSGFWRVSLFVIIIRIILSA